MVITSKESGLENRGARENERAGKKLNELCFVPEVSWIRPAQAYFVDRRTDGPTDRQTDRHNDTPVPTEISRENTCRRFMDSSQGELIVDGATQAGAPVADASLSVAATEPPRSQDRAYYV